ncbi:hypothetical protein [Undibacterium sp.]|jgi:hypothetical protein|uniref:hypothetical protein n=1 Tax=Undibacterium sp. TaxID=1914977 RepID=UPI002CC04C0D|nr:hypothetical protein [Undibacterium sp.]HTD06200.1 hypothetical protein [Undibacterium sp.]
MKTANSFKSGVIVATALVAAVFASGCAFQTAAQQPVAASGVQTVTIAAKRMTTDEKIAFDTANAGTQTVVLVAKRLTAEQKLAMLQEDMHIQASATRRSQPAA